MKKISILFAAILVVPCIQGVAQTTGIWIGQSEIAALPVSGTAWSNLKARADQSCGPVDLANQDQSNNVCVLAKALVFARTRQNSYAEDTVAALQSIVNMGTYNGRALALGRELGAYVIAADLIDLKNYNSSLDTQFRSKIKSLLTTPTTSGPSNLIDCHEDRPNNWGTHCGGARAAVDAYLDDAQDLDRVAQVFQGWLGDRESYAGFTYGDLSWQCDPSQPVGINPAGCTKNGYSLDGVLPDDQRRSGGFTWPPPHENYVYEALQGALMQAVILHRAGYTPFEWGDRALLRAFQWLYSVSDFHATGDDSWEPFVINYYYGTSFPADSPTTAGKNVGWTDWTHSGEDTPVPVKDTNPPTISNVTASVVDSATATVMWGTDEAADSQIEYGTTAACGSLSQQNSAMVTSHTESLSGLSPGTLYYFKVNSRDAAGNLATSGPTTFTTTGAASQGPCSTIAHSWQNSEFAAMSGTFTVEFDATPNVANMDGVIGLSSGAASSYAKLAAIVRFYTNGRIEARDGKTYAADTDMGYKAGTRYHFRFVVDMSSHTYDVYVTPQGGAETFLGRSYRFRSDNSGVTSLSNLVSYAASGGHEVCNLTVY